MANLKQILIDMAKSLVDSPDEVTVVISDETEDCVTFELSVAPDDMGKVIGRHGRIAKAIRTVMKSAANLEGKRVIVNIK
ncbi:MAG: KH domain-containing protein [Clostridia bacterium]|nr:KH domain-containing protein [Clostridia bacterium]MBR3715872.1 KH domain-containing protein [Clostridia bacterium]